MDKKLEEILLGTLKELEDNGLDGEFLHHLLRGEPAFSVLVDKGRVVGIHELPYWVEYTTLDFDEARTAQGTERDNWARELGIEPCTQDATWVKRVNAALTRLLWDI